MNLCESIRQGCFHWSRTKVKGSKTIRYRRSLNYKRCRLKRELKSTWNCWKGSESNQCWCAVIFQWWLLLGVRVGEGSPPSAAFSLWGHRCAVAARSSASVHTPRDIVIREVEYGFGCACYILLSAPWRGLRDSITAYALVGWVRGALFRRLNWTARSAV